MCGIVGYAGPGDTLEVLLAGLKRLEYRGYDSAGVAIVTDDHEMQVRKRAGKLDVLAADLAEHPLRPGHTGLGHTRWATHGAPTDANAHPQVGDHGRLAVIHNGIIENYAELKQELRSQGFEFSSDTDTEVAAVLIGREYERLHDLAAAFRTALRRFEGAFTLLAVHADAPGVVVGARRNSPLVIGRGHGENFLASDVAAFVAHTTHALAIGQDQMVVLTADSVTVTDFDGNAVEAEPFEVEWDASAAEKGGWSSFMAKEISEGPQAVADTLRTRIRGGVVALEGLGIPDAELELTDRIIVIACGTAAYAGLTSAYALEQWTGIPVDVQLSHEFRYRDPVIGAHTLIVAVSQSGETMDTLMAVRYARDHGARVLAVCNTQGATIARAADAVVYTHAGPEVAVASTKAYQAQVAALYLLGLHLARLRGTLPADRIAALLAELERVPDKLRGALAATEGIPQMAHWMADTRAVLFLGRNVLYPVALEGALKLKELAYIHAEGFAAGELKHGPIALIEPGLPVFVLLPSPRRSTVLHAKVLSNIQEIRARGARVIAVAEVGDVAVLPYADDVITVPLISPLFSPFLEVVPLQVFAMELSEAKGLDVDQPRNLAKSVTVE